jgi:uracil-DNA glycosylase family protein
MPATRTAPRTAALRTTEPWTAEPFVPDRRSLPVLREASRKCRGCPLWKIGTQTVFGEGNADARVVMVGEQPGDREDLAGRPFVGPAGKLLDEALVAAGIDRSAVYVTNAVKHFKWVPAGKRRLHKKPGAREIAACRPWLDAELETLKPDIVVALGATAAQALLGPDFRVTRDRGKIFSDVPWAQSFVATVHPSSILRGDPEEREAALAAFIADLKVVAKHLGKEGRGRGTR